MQCLPLLLIIALSITLEVEANDAKRTYHGHQLLRIRPRDRREANVLKSLKKNKHLKVDFLQQPTNRLKPVNVLVSPKHNKIVELLLENNGMDYDVTISDIQQAMDEQLAGRPMTGTGEVTLETFNLGIYHTLDEILKWLELLGDKYQDFIQVIDVGRSAEDRPIQVVKISTNADANKPAIWMDAGIHSNEWVGPATMLYFLNEFITKYATDPDVTSMVDTFDWFLMPVFNVDGYEYTWTNDRLWRKNRRRLTNSTCVGVDLNRNWGNKWGVGEVSHDPCHRLYVGPSAFSEPETRNVAEFLGRHNGTLQAYLAYHSFSQLWMFPYSYSRDISPSNVDDLVNISMEAVIALESVHGTQYAFGRIADLVGDAAGASVDYVYGELGVPFTFGIELRDWGFFGTLLPDSQIIPNAEESWAAVKRVAAILAQRQAHTNAQTEAEMPRESERRGNWVDGNGNDNSGPVSGTGSKRHLL